MEASEHSDQEQLAVRKFEDQLSNDGQENDEELEEDQNYHFYKEHCRLYYANIILTNRLQ